MAPYFVFYAARGVSGLIIPLYFRSIGIGLVQIGVALAINGVSILLFEVLWGFVIDRVGVTWTAPGAAVLTIFTYLLFPFVRTVPSAYAAAFLLGATAPAMIVIGRWLVVGESETFEWGGGFGILGASISLAYATGYIIGGVASSLAGYGGAFYLAALLSVLAYPLFRSLKSASSQQPSDPVLTEPKKDAGRTLRFDSHTLLILSLIAIPLFMGSAFFTSLMQLIVTQTRSFGASDADASILLALYSLSSAFFQPLLGRMLARRARVYIAIGLLLNFCIFILLTQATNMIEVDGLALAEGFCFAIVSPLSLSLLMVRTPKKFTGRVMGIYGAAEDVGITLGPPLGAVAWASYGLDAAYLTIALPFLAAVVFWGLALGRRSNS